MADKTVLRNDNILRLSDGGRLSYAEYGDPNGQPVFLVHGTPGSRLYWKSFPGFPFRPDLHFIALDRPGYGLSDWQPGRTMTDWPDNVAALADALGLHQFAMIGVSGGGPETLACAWKIPERLTAVGVLHSPGPPDAPDYFAGMSRTNRFFLRLAARSPWLMRKNMALVTWLVRRNPAKYVERMTYKFSAPDKAAIARPEIRESLVQNFAEALGQPDSARAYGDDVVLHQKTTPVSPTPRRVTWQRRSPIARRHSFPSPGTCGISIIWRRCWIHWFPDDLNGC
jgi:pimeloyl-ACP methyl ester carboxylesterase